MRLRLFFLTFIVMSDIVIRRVLEASFAPVLITQWHDDDDEETLFFRCFAGLGSMATRQSFRVSHRKNRLKL
jgi:hypothetical protein